MVNVASSSGQCVTGSLLKPNYSGLIAAIRRVFSLSWVMSGEERGDEHFICTVVDNVEYRTYSPIFVCYTYITYSTQCTIKVLTVQSLKNMKLYNTPTCMQKILKYSPPICRLFGVTHIPAFDHTVHATWRAETDRNDCCKSLKHAAPSNTGARDNQHTDIKRAHQYCILHVHAALM